METNAIDDQKILDGLLRPSSRQQAFQLLLKKYAPGLYYFLRHLGLDHEDADEQVQEIVVKFWRSLNGLKDSDRLDITLYNTAVKAGVIFLGKRSGLNIDGLSTEQKMVFTLKQQDFDHHDIAIITGLPINEVRDHFRSALTIMADKKPG